MTSKAPAVLTAEEGPAIRVFQPQHQRREATEWGYFQDQRVVQQQQPRHPMQDEKDRQAQLQDHQL